MMFGNESNGNETIVRELKSLTEHRDNEVCAKSMCTLTRLNQLDDMTIETATRMLESQ